jgi:hypothetical protein
MAAMSSGDMTLRSVCAARAAWGLLLIATPRVVLRAGRGRNDRTSRTVLRVLGIRHLAQAVTVTAVPTVSVQRVGVVVDVLHTASAAALAYIDRGQRRFALTETADASLWAGSGWLLQRRHHQPGCAVDRTA